MPNRLRIAAALFVGWALSPSLRAQETRRAAVIQELPCSYCHTCNAPTANSPCLRACPRRPGAGPLPSKTGPGVIILNELENLYLPVPFDHGGHAEMTMMTDGAKALDADERVGIKDVAEVVAEMLE